MGIFVKSDRAAILSSDVNYEKIIILGIKMHILVFENIFSIQDFDLRYLTVFSASSRKGISDNTLAT